MACFYPLKAWQTEAGMVFHETADSLRSLFLPCGQCVGCRLERSRQWAVRCMHESQMHDVNSFVTLTYSEDSLSSWSLVYSDFQKFVKRLRRARATKSVRFYMCGEYGDDFGRPHFHACLFGVHFPDREYWRDLPSGGRLYTSKELERLWPHGFSSIGDVTFESAAYVARYVMKKMTGQNAEKHYQLMDQETGEVINRVPEFNRMSLKPGIGYPWFEKYKREVFPRDEVVVNGFKAKPPRYYDKLLEKDLSFSEENKCNVEFGRWTRAARTEYDCTPERLKVREVVTHARLNFKKRTL